MFKKSLKPKTLGKALKKARLSRCLTIAQICALTKISPKLLIALENEKYAELPDGPYIKCFIKCCCDNLNLDENEFLSLYNKDEKIAKLKSSTLNQPIKKISWRQMLVAPKLFRALIIFFVISVCLIYLGRKIQAIVRPPELKITNPASDTITNSNSIQISGITEPETTLIINGEKVIVQADGSFYQPLFLQPGLNTIKISAKKRHSAEIVEYRRIIVEEK